MFLFSRADRTPPQTDAERATLFSGMTAYTGHVRIEAEDRFVITVDLAWDPGWTGEQVRYFTLEGNRLMIRAPAQMHPQTGGRLFVGDLVWERET
jgi:Lipocalin-like domain